MDRQFLNRYNDELRHLRENAAEFAREFPKIAGRLALDEFECADPYVERLLEGFAFLTARVQVKFDAEFDRFTQSLFETIYPQYLAPTPSAAVVQFQPDPANPAPPEGSVVPRDTVLLGKAGDDETGCEYRTCAEMRVWPLEITRCDYLIRELGTLSLPAHNAKAAVRIGLRALGSLQIGAVKGGAVRFHIRGGADLPMQIYEQIFAHLQRVVIVPRDPDLAPRHLPASALRQVGFDDDTALLPTGPRSFIGYRLLKEYFTLPQKFLFFDIVGLQDAWAGLEDTEADLVLLMDEEELELEGRMETANIQLGCTTAINLFPKRADRIHLTDKQHEHQVIADRTHPLDYEIHQVLSVTGLGQQSDDRQPFLPFYSANDVTGEDAQGAGYYVNKRVPRLPSNLEKQRGRRTSYGGSEIFLSLVDGANAPYRSSLRQLSIQALCTNRDLPLRLPVGKGDTDFDLSTSLPVKAVRCLVGPTAPQASHAQGEYAWRLISHLSLNYLSLVDAADGQGAVALREMLKLYSGGREAHLRKQVEGLLSVKSRAVVRRAPLAGPISFVRGLEVEIEFDEDGYEGTGVFLIGAVLERFLAKHASLNSFTETVIHTKQRGMIKRWPSRMGNQFLL